MVDSPKSAAGPARGIDSKWWTLAVVGASTFMSSLDGSVVNTALPVIGRETGSGVTTLEWVVLIYLLTVSSSLLVFGRLADIYGLRGIYLTGIGVFVGASVLCGLSPGIEALIAARGVQALGAAILFALGPAVITGAFPGQERGRALGLQATITYLGLATGPALGGFLTQHLGWPSIFFINVPIGAIVIPAAVKVLKTTTARNHQPFDPAGAVTLALALASLLIALSKGNELGWGSPFIVTMLVLSVAAFGTFITVERRIEHPVLDLSLFRNQTFAASAFVAFLNYMAVSSMSFLMPFYLIVACGYPVGTAGLILISTPITMATIAGTSGWLSDKIGHRIPTTLGMAITVLGLFTLRTLHPGARPVEIVPHLMLIGLGIGLFTSPNNSAIMGSAPRDRQGVAGALLAAARNIGFAMGVAIAALIYTMRLHALDAASSHPEAVTRAMQDATSTIAAVAVAGVVISAMRGAEHLQSRRSQNR